MGGEAGSLPPRLPWRHELITTASQEHPGYSTNFPTLSPRQVPSRLMLHVLCTPCLGHPKKRMHGAGGVEQGKPRCGFCPGSGHHTGQDEGLGPSPQVPGWPWGCRGWTPLTKAGLRPARHGGQALNRMPQGAGSPVQGQHPQNHVGSGAWPQCPARPQLPSTGAAQA